MKKRLLLLLAVAPLASCIATQAAVERANTAALEARQAAFDAQTKANNPEVTQWELDQAVAMALAKGEEAIAAAAAIPEAMQADRDNLIKGLGDLGGAGGGGIAALALTAAAWWMRDRRKLAGKDPLEKKIKDAS